MWEKQKGKNELQRQKQKKSEEDNIEKYWTAKKWTKREKKWGRKWGKGTTGIERKEISKKEKVSWERK